MIKTVVTVKGSTIYTKDKLKSFDKVEKEVTFTDSTVPTVQSVTAKGNKKLVVKFSEPVKVPNIIAAAGSSFKINGSGLHL
ncbi:hypothetical protein PB1_08437 [Bacillus methanolicus PB1]|uniref:SbsA Ig-like domain-containing protein n=1 Tax=Bacillus methanolicus PB1 TaxID=997296 RepID=I3E1K4_BACMT|nr:hypothetical protein [Bacillus methanolicus]EIJ80375.1 hypothetical protein PB1_08437 [Bacillus methanolicus PB1]